MQPVVTDRVAWCVGRSVCLSVTVVSPAKRAKAIDVLFGYGLGWDQETMYY